MNRFRKLEASKTETEPEELPQTFPSQESAKILKRIELLEKDKKQLQESNLLLAAQMKRKARPQLYQTSQGPKTHDPTVVSQTARILYNSVLRKKITGKFKERISDLVMERKNLDSFVEKRLILI